MKDEREIYQCKIGMVAMYGKGGRRPFFAGHGYLMGEEGRMIFYGGCILCMLRGIWMASVMPGGIWIAACGVMRVVICVYVVRRHVAVLY